MLVHSLPHLLWGRTSLVTPLQIAIVMTNVWGMEKRNYFHVNGSSGTLSFFHLLEPSNNLLGSCLCALPYLLQFTLCFIKDKFFSIQWSAPFQKSRWVTFPNGSSLSLMLWSHSPLCLSVSLSCFHWQYYYIQISQFSANNSLSLKKKNLFPELSSLSLTTIFHTLVSRCGMPLQSTCNLLHNISGWLH